MHIRATSTFSSRSSPLGPQREENKIKLFTQESSQQTKEEQEIFLGFLLVITTTGMESAGDITSECKPPRRGRFTLNYIEAHKTQKMAFYEA